MHARTSRCSSCSSRYRQVDHRQSQAIGGFFVIALIVLLIVFEAQLFSA